MTSVLPGTLVQSLVTSVLPDGLNLQILGFFGGTIDLFHTSTSNPEATYKVGQKLKARVLYDVAASTPPRFALSLADHILKLTSRSGGGSDHEEASLQDAYPVGTILDAVKVIRVEAERGLVVEISSGVEGFIHVRTDSRAHPVQPNMIDRFHTSPMITFHPCHHRQGAGNWVRYTKRESQDISS